MVKGRSSGSQPYTGGSEGQGRLLQADQLWNASR